MLKYGWQAGYSAVYANPRSQTMISAGVSRFATSGGAHSALLYVDVAYPKALPKIARSAVHITRVAGVSDEATAIVLNAKPSMVSVMFRQGSYLGSVIVTGSVALPSVVSLARTADARVKSNS
jgi:hypothetical protein